MFDRNVKLQFNKMKYAAVNNKTVGKLSIFYQ